MIMRIAIGVLAFFIGLALFLPARTVVGWAGDTGDVGLHDVSGTSYRAHVDSVTYKGVVAATDVQWQWQPSRLLLARGAGHVTGNVAGGLVEADVAATPTGTYLVNDLRGVFALADVLEVANLAGVGITGDVGLNIAKLRAKGEAITDIDGQIDAIDLAWRFGNKRYALGNFSAVARMEDGVVVADVNDADGPVAAEGELRFDPTARTWQFNGRVKPRSSADPVLVNLMSGGLGRAGADGWFSLKRSGRI